jgi:glutamine amidotransferase PdxT
VQQINLINSLDLKVNKQYQGSQRQSWKKKTKKKQDFTKKKPGYEGQM